MTSNLPATVGMSLQDVDTPCLLVDLDAYERNVEKLGEFIKKQGVRHRTHAKPHKSFDIAKYQIEKGGACGVCCQKVSEAEALVNAGLTDILVSNEVVAPKKIERLVALARACMGRVHAGNYTLRNAKTAAYPLLRRAGWYIVDRLGI